MPVFSIRGEDGISREVELELGACDICHKVVLQACQDPLPPPFSERQWPAVKQRLEALGLLPQNVSGPRVETEWSR